jgi:hypothetical protein
VTARPNSLSGLPPVLFLEAPSSWLTRAALSQGVEVNELLAHLGLGRERDSDLEFLGVKFRDIQRLCALPPDAFAVTRRIFKSVLDLGSTGERLLLKTEEGTPRYRVCPSCLSEQQTPYHAIHCRFAAWCYCPVHECLLQDSCWSCRAAIALPASLIARGRLEGLCAYLSQCLGCAKSHCRAPLVSLTAVSPFLSSFESDLLANGRATLAALYQRRVALPSGEAATLSEVRTVERRGMLATQRRPLTAEVFRDRLKQIIGDQVNSLEPPPNPTQIVRPADAPVLQPRE